MEIYTDYQIRKAKLAELREMLRTLKAHIDSMPGGIVRQPYLLNYWAIENEIDRKTNIILWAMNE